MYTNTSITVYNHNQDSYIKHIIPSVFWDGGKEVSLGGGTSKIDRALILIPEDDLYREPKVWEGMSDINKAIYYTIRPNGKDRIVKGNCDYDYGALHPITELIANYDNVLIVTRVEDRRYGSYDMRHIEVGGV